MLFKSPKSKLSKSVRVELVYDEVVDDIDGKKESFI